MAFWNTSELCDIDVQSRVTVFLMLAMEEGLKIDTSFGFVLMIHVSLTLMTFDYDSF